MRDYLTRGGAKALADKICDSWRKRGHDVDARVELATDWRSPIHVVRSNMVRGMPASKRADDGVANPYLLPTDRIRTEPMISAAAIEAMFARLAITAPSEAPDFFNPHRFPPIESSRGF